MAYVGTDYLSHGLWDKYIKFESAQGAFSNVTGLYLRILGSPLKDIDRYYDRCTFFNMCLCSWEINGAVNLNSTQTAVIMA